MMGISVPEAKRRLEEQDRIRDGLALQAEKRAAVKRSRRIYRHNEELDGKPVIAMSKRRYIKLHRASLIERDCKGGELLSEDCDFTEWALKRPDMEQCKIVLQKTMNKIGWTPPNTNARLANAAEHGRRERAGKLVFDTERGAWV